MEIFPRCGICYELIREPVVLPCRHEMCQECFKRSMETANFNCPICRKRCSSWARRNSVNPVNKTRKLELDEYYKSFDSLETLELILQMKDEEEESACRGGDEQHRIQLDQLEEVSQERVELDRLSEEVAIKMQEEEVRQISSEVERDACIARELSQQLNQHDESAQKVQLEEDRKMAEWLNTAFNNEKTTPQHKAAKPLKSSSPSNHVHKKKSQKASITSPTRHSSLSSQQLSLWFKPCPRSSK